MLGLGALCSCDLFRTQAWKTKYWKGERERHGERKVNKIGEGRRKWSGKGNRKNRKEGEQTKENEPMIQVDIFIESVQKPTSSWNQCRFALTEVTRPSPHRAVDTGVLNDPLSNIVKLNHFYLLYLIAPFHQSEVDGTHWSQPRLEMNSEEFIKNWDPTSYSYTRAIIQYLESTGVHDHLMIQGATSVTWW